MNDIKLLIDSVELFVIPNKARFIVYIPLKGIAMILNKEGINVLKEYSLKGKVLNKKFVDKFFNIFKQKDTINIYKSFKYNDNDSLIFQPTLLGLALTTSCNLNCKYCHSNANEVQMKLDFKTAKVAIDFVHKNVISKKEKFEVNFAGYGEPTVSWKLLDECIKYIQEVTSASKVKTEISMATNGVFSMNKTKYIMDNFAYVSLSFDGYSEIQEIHRPLKNRYNSFDIVYRTAKTFYRNKFPFSIRATISNYSVCKMTKIYEFFQSEFPGIKVGFEALNPIGRGSKCELTRPKEKLFINNFLKVVNLSKKIGGTVINSGLGRINEIRTVFCKSLSAPSITITPEGNITACQRDGSPEYFYYGKINKNDNSMILDSDKINNFRKHDIRSYPECNNCFCKYHCAGDCYDLRLENIKRCNFIRQISINNIMSKLNFN